ncbi:MAG: TonB family protein [Steroidobacteraceae bacterium]|nr:TonB family protein [Steroidobacteraceae bacterium]MDW8259744.1 TonB family protein [Gammaproteobacteria bacterium]
MSTPPAPLRFYRAAEGFAPTRDRLTTTLFVASLAHAVLIAGVSFSANNAEQPTPSVDVILTAEELPTAAENETAAYVAQRTQLGAGTTRRKQSPRRPLAPPEQAPLAGSEHGDPVVPSDGASAQGRARGGELVLTAQAAAPDIVWTGQSSHNEANRAMRQAVPAVVPPAPPGNDPIEHTELTGPARDELSISPDARAALFAPYVDAWRRKVERLGTLNFPPAARRLVARRQSVSPVVEVALSADGQLVEARIQRGSGDAQVDQAALQILRMASPFDPFPAELAAATEVLRFAYEWRFECLGTLCRSDPTPHTDMR